MSDKGDEFYRAVPPPKSAGIIQKEKPWHRVAAYCVALGASDSQIAKVVSHSRQAVWELRQQPWFQQRVARIHAEHGGQVARRMLEEASPLAVQKLVELMQSGDLQVETRSAVEIVKAVVGSKLTIEAKTQTMSLEELNEEEARLKEEIALLMPGGAPKSIQPIEGKAKSDDLQHKQG